MSSPLKAQGQTAYERWEMASFAEDRTQSVPIRKREQPMPEIQQRLAALAETARQQGYAAGQQQGYADGMQQAAEAMRADQQAMSALTVALDLAAQKSDREIAEHLLQLALDLARTMLKTALAVDQTAILPIVREAIQSLPYVQQSARIRLNPQDATAVRQYLAEEAAAPWQLIEDARVERGGCLLETGANQLDASNSMRWQRIAEALGQNTEWSAA